jgi:hypothetical protein
MYSITFIIKGVDLKGKSDRINIEAESCPEVNQMIPCETLGLDYPKYFMAEDVTLSPWVSVNQGMYPTITVTVVPCDPNEKIPMGG